MFHRITILGRVVIKPTPCTEGIVLGVGTIDDFQFKVYCSGSANQLQIGEQVYIEGRLRGKGLEVLADKIYGVGAITKTTRRKFGIEDADF